MVTFRISKVLYNLSVIIIITTPMTTNGSKPLCQSGMADWGSAASMRSLQNAILSQHFRALEYVSQIHSITIWKSPSSAEVPAPTLQHVQKPWDGLIASKFQAEILGMASDVSDKARLLATASPHSDIVYTHHQSAPLVSDWTTKCSESLLAWD